MRPVFNDSGEPIGTERTPDQDEQYDSLMDEYDRLHYEPEADECYFCGRTYCIDYMIPFEVEKDGKIVEVFACGHCEEEIQ